MIFIFHFDIRAVRIKPMAKGKFLSILLRFFIIFHQPRTEDIGLSDGLSVLERLDERIPESK